MISFSEPCAFPTRHTTFPVLHTVSPAPCTIQPCDGDQPRICENRDSRSVLLDTVRRYHWANLAIRSIKSGDSMPSASMIAPSSRKRHTAVTPSSTRILFSDIRAPQAVCTALNAAS